MTNTTSEQTMTIHLRHDILEMTTAQYLNYLAIHLLEIMGNHCPTQTQIDELEEHLHKLISQNSREKIGKIYFATSRCYDEIFNKIEHFEAA